MSDSSESPTPRGESFSRRLRLRRRREFQEVFARRCSKRDRLLVVYGRLNGLPHARLGIAVSRRLGKAAVRNRWKRRLREAFRRERAVLPGGIDFVVIPTAPAPAGYRDVCKSLKLLTSEVARRLRRESR